MGVSAQTTKIHLALAAWEWPAYFAPEARAKGIRMKWANWARPAPHTAATEAKAAGLYMTGLYMIYTLSKHMAEAEGFDDALMLDWRGHLLGVGEFPRHNRPFDYFDAALARFTPGAICRLMGEDFDRTVGKKVAAAA